jgi:acyl phosphate:glycerol-3-phosphate acyltransferase
VRALRGVDIRTVGSGNVGATNAGRVLGRPWGVAIYLLDAAKGAGAVLLGRWLARDDPALQAGCGLFAILGHVFPVWLRFRGGKGVATMTGVFAALVPRAFLIAGAAWVAAAALTRFVSIASVALALALPIAVIAFHREDAFRSRLPITLLSLAASAFVIVRHLPNLRRVVEGTEPRIGGRSSGRSPS